MRTTRTLALILASIGYIIALGGATYEHLAVVPQWSAAPPASLTMFQGEYGLASGRFWPTVHVVTLALMVAAVVLNWKTPRRPYVAGGFAGYLLVIGATAVYYLPELSAIINTPYAAAPDPELTARAQFWERASIVRYLLMIVTAIVLLLGLTKGNDAP